MVGDTLATKKIILTFFNHTMTRVKSCKIVGSLAFSNSYSSTPSITYNFSFCSKLNIFQPCLICLQRETLSLLTACDFCFRKVYNVVDDDPAPREEVFAYAGDLVEKKWPCRIKQSAGKSESVVEQGSRRGEKRVSNSRVKKELGMRLLHPSYRSGLQSIINHL